MKLCLSSRPWSVFEEAFAGRAVPHMRLRDLSYRDMHRYAGDRLRLRVGIGHLFSHNVQREDRILDEIVTKADDVFFSGSGWQSPS